VFHLENSELQELIQNSERSVTPNTNGRLLSITDRTLYEHDALQTTLPSTFSLLKNHSLHWTLQVHKIGTGRSSIDPIGGRILVFFYHRRSGIDLLLNKVCISFPELQELKQIWNVQLTKVAHLDDVLH
jgi:hypothetical protein